MIPGPRPADGQACSLTGSGDPGTPPTERERPPVALTRTPGGWVVRSTDGVDSVGDVVEGMSLADLIAEEFGLVAEPDRTARRSARGTVVPAAAVPAAVDEAGLRIAALERTIAQLEHALAARVSTERAIGVLAERNSVSARAAFEVLRRDARSQGRPVAELARTVLDSLTGDEVPRPDATAAPVIPLAVADGRS